MNLVVWKVWVDGNFIKFALFTLDLFDSPLGREPDDLVEGGGDYPHAMNPWLSKGDILGWWAVKYCKDHIELHRTGIDRECDVCHGEILLPIEDNKDGIMVVDVGLIDLNILKCIQK